MTWTQVYDPLGHWWLSTLLAALPIVVLLGLLAGLKVRPHLCTIAGAATAVLVAMIVFQMPALLAVGSFFYGAAFGLLKIVWIVIAAVSVCRSRQTERRKDEMRLISVLYSILLALPRGS